MRRDRSLCVIVLQDFSRNNPFVHHRAGSSQMPEGNCYLAGVAVVTASGDPRFRFALGRGARRAMTLLPTFVIRYLVKQGHQFTGQPQTPTEAFARDNRASRLKPLPVISLA